MYLSGNIDKLDVIILTEINVDDKTSALFQLPGFVSLARFRKEWRGGGLLVMGISLDIVFKFGGVLVREVHKCDISFLISSVYAPPSVDINCFYDNPTQLLNRFNNNKFLLLPRDFNIHILDYRETGIGDYLDILSGYGMENAITDYTREETLGIE